MKTFLPLVLSVLFSVPVLSQSQLENAEKTVAELDAKIKIVADKARADLNELRAELILALESHESQLRTSGKANEAKKIRDRIDFVRSKPVENKSTATPASPAKLSLSEANHNLSSDGMARPYFVVYCNVKNLTDAVIGSTEVFVRRLRIDRPLPDYEWNGLVEIKGGVGPKETIPWVFSIPTNALGVSTRPRIEKHETLQVSLDGKKWVDVPLLFRPDPFMQQLMNAPVGRPRK